MEEGAGDTVLVDYRTSPEAYSPERHVIMATSGDPNNDPHTNELLEDIYGDEQTTILNRMRMMPVDCR